MTGLALASPGRTIHPPTRMPPGLVVPGLVFGVILALLLVATLIRARREED